MLYPPKSRDAASAASASAVACTRWIQERRSAEEADRRGLLFDDDNDDGGEEGEGTYEWTEGLSLPYIVCQREGTSIVSRGD